MSKAGKSLYYFGIYVLIIGILILVIPETFISVLKLPEIPIGWARVIGLLVLIIGSYDMISGKNNILPLIKASIYLRFLFTLGVLILVVSNQMTIELIPLGAIDALGAIWTLLALKSKNIV